MPYRTALLAAAAALPLFGAASPAAAPVSPPPGLPGDPGAAPGEARLLRFPDIHGDLVVFCHAGDLWTVPTAGGEARRLTTSEGLELFPRFSPDGRWIAFTGQYDGSSDVYVLPTAGGEPRRLSYYPSVDLNERMGWDNMVLGWTPDGRVLFRSQRGPITGFAGQPFVVSPEGGAPERFPLPETGTLSFSPDGKRLAYNRNFRDFRTWKRYQGGQAQDVWVHDLESRATERITDWAGADMQPMWVGNAVYFISDREDWNLNLWRTDLGTRATTRVTDFTEFDVKWAHSGTGRIVFENGGWLWWLDPASASPARRIPVTLADDRKLARSRWVAVADRVSDFTLAPGGKRAVFSARGDLFTVPAEHGNTRNLTASQGVREKYATWSPDGAWVAYVSDASGEEELVLVPQDGKGAPVQLTTGSSSWHFPPVWSPDSTRLAWADRAMRLWFVDVKQKKPVLVDTNDVWEISEYTWSPDSRWIAYTKYVENEFTALFLYSVAGGSRTQATSSFERSRGPRFDPEGKYLWFLSDRDINPVMGGFEASFTTHRMTRPHALTLRADLPSPFAPRTDEVGDEVKEKEAEQEGKDKDGKDTGGADKGKGATGKAAGKEVEPIRIDLPGIQERVVGFPVPPGDYAGLTCAKGKVYYLSLPIHALTDDKPAQAAIRVFDLKTRKDGLVLDGVSAYDLEATGEKILVHQGETWTVIDAKEGAKLEEGRKLDLSGLRMELDPKAEWRQVFHETWRVCRDFFYLKDMGQVDWAAMRKRYEPLVRHVSHRADLTYVLGEMISELGSGHSYTGGGEQPHPDRTSAGVLGADLVLEARSGRWRIERIFQGQNWDPKRRSPLTEPGIRVAAGEYLLRVDGHDLGAGDDPYRLLMGSAEKTVTLTVNGRPVLDGSREVLVSPLASEQALRYHDWVETNRQKVDKATQGRVGYVHIPNMGGEGLREFIRQYFPQMRKEGLIVDVRSNGGGFVSQMILERLRRKPMAMGGARNARSSTWPDASFAGPMVALLNMYSASDGDIFPYFFREYGLGPLIGQRSWGGTVGIRGVGGDLVDGGYLFVPEFGLYNFDRKWIIENHGVDPDIAVDNLPGDEWAGKDAQLERAMEEVLKAIAARPPSWPGPPEPVDLRKPDPKRGVELQ